MAGGGLAGNGGAKNNGAGPVAGSKTVTASPILRATILPSRDKISFRPMPSASIAKLVLPFACTALMTLSAAPIEAPAAFAELKKLVGEWEGKTASGRALKVSFRLTAAESVLVETWTLGPQRESLTLYHMDKQSLVATHYCPVGNQPHLRLKEPADSSLLKFEFVSATNLPKPEASHQHQFEIEVIDAASFARSEAYLENGTSESERIVYSRISR